MKRKLTTSRLAAALVLAVALTAGAYAAPAGVDGGRPGAQMAGQPGHHMAHGLRALSRLHDDLKLDARQEALWADAASASKAARATMRDGFSTQRQEMLASLSQPGADLRALVKRSDEVRTEARKQHEATRDRWLVLYDTLNAEQKEKARVFLTSMFERGGRHSPSR